MIIIKLGFGQRELSFLFIQPRFVPFPLNLLGKYYEKSCRLAFNFWGYLCRL